MACVCSTKSARWRPAVYGRMSHRDAVLCLLSPRYSVMPSLCVLACVCVCVCVCLCVVVGARIGIVCSGMVSVTPSIDRHRAFVWPGAAGVWS